MKHRVYFPILEIFYETCVLPDSTAPTCVHRRGPSYTRETGSWPSAYTPCPSVVAGTVDGTGTVPPCRRCVRCRQQLRCCHTALCSCSPHPSAGRHRLGTARAPPVHSNYRHSDVKHTAVVIPCA